jgi:hypothetical protein
MASASRRASARRRASAGCLLAVLSLLAAGCGTTMVQRDQRYSTALQAADQAFSANVRSILALSPASPTSRTAELMGRYEAAVARMDTRLRQLRAPATVSPLHRHLIKAIDRYGADVRRAVAALRVADRSTRATGTERFQSATRSVQSDVNATVARIRARLSAAGGGGG